MSGKTLYDKLWDEHVVVQREDGSALIYIDRHLLHEVTSPQAFSGLKLAGRKPWRIDANLATPDHNVPTTDRDKPIVDETSRIQVQTLDENCAEWGITEFKMNDIRQGIVHVIGPEQGATLPGMTIVCGDSHTATHGAFAALAQGIGTSEVEHVLATQCLSQQKMKNLLVKVNGHLQPGVYSKDLILAIIGKIGTAGGNGCAMEFAGEAISDLSMEARMTLCNMAIEAGARVGLVAVDDKTIEYVKGRPFSPQGEQWIAAEKYWRTLVSDMEASDENAMFDIVVELNAADITPYVSWGTSPEMVIPINESLPDPLAKGHEEKREAWQRAYEYMGLKPGMSMGEVTPDRVFIGSCTNSRIEDLRIAASIIKGRKKSPKVKQVLVVPGSGLVKQQAEAEGLDKIFIAADFEWREPGCSMCLAMNADRLQDKEHCASTSNRNFEGRQGYGGRTHLVSPAMAAAAAIAGKFVDVREFI